MRPIELFFYRSTCIEIDGIRLCYLIHLNQPAKEEVGRGQASLWSRSLVSANPADWLALIQRLHEIARIIAHTRKAVFYDEAREAYKLFFKKSP
jgi:hypothetical protein